MRNVDRLSKFITKHGSKSILIHTIPKTGTWIVAEKTTENSWFLRLMNPLGNVSYSVGIVSAENYLKIWKDITRCEIESQGTQIQQAKEMRKLINNFLKKYN